PGAFEYSFVLTDSLDLDLDSDYLLTLEERSSRKYDLDEYDGDLDDEEYAAKRKVVMRGTFNLEEYELESITFSARSDKAVHSRGEEASVYLKASDENGLTVMDGRVELFVTTAPYGQKDFSPPRLFLPDTLWRYSQVLEPAGETKVLLPDSIFPKAGFTYNIECIFLNSNNERRTQTLHQKFQQAPARITFDLTGDSLHIDHLVKGISQPVEATLYAITGEDDSLSEHRVRLPATVRVHPLATLYEIETEDLNEEFNVTASPPVSAQSLRTADSVFVRLVNPSRLPVWYTLFAGNKVVQRGYGDDLLFEAKAVTRKNYFLSLQYLFYNKVHNQDYIVPFYDKLLSVNFVQPAAVYPGQTASISVVVNDAHGYPVADADVTAWSYTKKFTGGRLPSLPYFGRQYPGRKRYAKFREDEEMDFSTGTRLAWQRWSREMHLDTIEYYKFLHPEDLYINTEPAPDSLTQLAPFVVKGGEVVPVHQIYIDDLPVFFSAAEHLQRYSFAVSPGKHNLRLRTPTAMIWLDSITVTKGVKTFISIEAEATNLRIRMQKAPPNLMPYERTLWSRYMILLQNDFGNRYASVENGLQVFPLLPPSYRKPVWVGPLANQYADLVVKNGFTQRFETEGNYHYFISKGLIKQKQLPGVTSLPHTLSLTAKEQDFRDRVFTTKELDSLWQEFLYSRSASTELFYNPSLSKEGNGKLEIALDKTSNKENLFVRNIFLFRHDDPDYLRIYPGNWRDLGYVQPGLYRLLFLLKNDAYLIKDSVVVKENGINFYQVAVSDVRRKDSTSTRISAIVHEKEQFNYGQADFNAIKETFNSRYFDRSLLTETVSGIVRDKDGQLLPGISVMLKGSGIGALTNQQGEYVMQVPPDGTLVVGGVGFVAEEKKLKGSETVHFSLAKAKYNLDEVVVVGYGNSRQRSITGSVSVVDGYLSGKVPGVMIRGINSIDGNNAPLLIIDGLPYAGKLDDLDPSLIVNTNVLKGEAATAIYGAQAAGGVLIITTKGAKLNAAETPGGDGPVASSLRQHFRDYAYWQPRLKTDLAGKATFTVTYPDDITAWRSFAMVMGNDRQTGSAEG
ncbi:MAG TPA: carboxypeptidase-like regulatory domain-containing protein, partial [Flavisolibacter sp.]|nr:carboxypeptidase-like regulatory domain-containing protein [Flavisolibacter sp.]